VQAVAITVAEIEATEPELIQDSELQTSPLPAHATEATQLFLTEENNHSQLDDIMDIIHSCLKAAKKYDPGHSVTGSRDRTWLHPMDRGKFGEPAQCLAYLLSDV